MFGTSKDLIERFVSLLRRPDRKTKKKCQQFDDGFDFVVEESIEMFLGVEIHPSRNKAHTRQVHLIDRIIDAIGLTSKLVGSKPKLSTQILHEDENGEDRKDSWNS